VPRILVTGLPGRLQGHPALIELLTKTLPLVVEGVRGFGISRDHVFAHAVPDLADVHRAVVTFTVEGLLVKPERTPAMRQHLSDAVADAIAACLDQAGIRYDSIVGWCVQIDRGGDGFVRRPSGKPSADTGASST
jgi:hypothetical protein